MEPDDIQRLVRIEVEAQIAKEGQVLRRAVALSTKIVGATIGLLLVVFLVLGLITWQQIRQHVAEIVTAQAEALVRTEPDASLEDKLNNVVNRAVVAAELARRDRSEPVELARNDWDRLRVWITKEDLPIQDFADAVRVLHLQTDQRRTSDANRLFADMLSTQGHSQYRWIFKQPRKIEAILALFPHQDLGRAAVELIASTALSDTLRGLAAKYVLDVGYDDEVDKMLRTYTELQWGSAKENIIVACALLRSDDPRVLSEIDRLLLVDPVREQLSALVRIVFQSHKAGLQRFERPEFQTTERRGTSIPTKNIVRYLVSNGVFFQSFFHQDLRYGVTSHFIHAKLRTSPGRASDLGQLSSEEFSAFAPYWALLEECANANDIDCLGAFLIAEDFSQAAGSWLAPPVRLTADSGAIVEIRSNGGVKRELQLDNLSEFYIVGDQSNAGVVRAYWLEDAGGEDSGLLRGLRGTGFELFLSERPVNPLRQITPEMLEKALDALAPPKRSQLTNTP